MFCKLKGESAEIGMGQVIVYIFIKGTSEILITYFLWQKTKREREILTD